MVATQVSWWPDVVFFRSTDAGATWTRIWDWANYPERSLRYTQDISAVPWLTFGVQPAPPAPSPKLGWMTESVEIDPFDSNHLLYGTGATIYGTTDLTKWDSGGKITIKPVVGGLEETAVLDLISPPSGAPLLSGLGDVGGFRHDSLDAVPATMYTSPVFTTTTSLDYAELNPATVVRAGTLDRSARPNDNRIAFSTDGGKNWFQGGEPGGGASGGTVAAAADGSRFVWSPDGAGVSYSAGVRLVVDGVRRHPGRGGGRGRPRRPEAVLRVRRGPVLRQHRRRGDVRRDRGHRAAHRPGALQGDAGRDRRRLAGRRLRHGVRPLALHRLRSVLHEAGGVTEADNVGLRQGRSRPDVFGVIHDREDRRGARDLPVGRRGWRRGRGSTTTGTSTATSGRR